MFLEGILWFCLSLTGFNFFGTYWADIISLDHNLDHVQNFYTEFFFIVTVIGRCGNFRSMIIDPV